MKPTIRTRFVAIIFLIIFMTTLFALFACSGTKGLLQITTSEITVENYTPSISNYGQVNDTYDACQMAYSNGKLYIYYSNTPLWDYGLAHTLVCVENGKIVPVLKCSQLIGGYGDYIYYFDFYDANNYKFELKASLCVYNTKTKTSKKLLTTEGNHYQSTYDFTSDGVLRMRFRDDDTSICHIKSDEYLGAFVDDMPPNTIRLGDDTYALSGPNSILCNGQVITNKFPPSPIRSIYSVGDGIVVNNFGAPGGNIASFIKPNGEIVALMPEMEYDSITNSLAVYENYVFISFERRQSILDAFTTAKYENDMLSGTYRIDVRDLSVTKISEQYFDSMFIFDDTGIFGNNSSGSYKIDFDGNQLLTIIEG